MHHKTKGTLALSTVARGILIGVLDVITVAVSFFFALWMRHDFVFSHIDEAYVRCYQYTIPSFFRQGICARKCLQKTSRKPQSPRDAVIYLPMPSVALASAS